MTSREIKLAWVIVDGVSREVTDFSGLPRSSVPVDARCPECDQPVVLRLGDERTHHAAHKSGSKCTGTGPETILHVNTKYFLAKQLRDGAALTLEQACAGVPRLTFSHRFVLTDWASSWTDVVVEQKIGTLRPDVALLRGSTTIAAIEVVVSNPVSDEKAQALRELGLPWAEVMASTVAISGDSPWHCGSPLPVVRTSLHPQQPCEECQAEVERFSEKRAALERNAPAISDPDEQMAVSGSTTGGDAPSGQSGRPWDHRIVHYYFASGKKFSETIDYGQVFERLPGPQGNFRWAYESYMRGKLSTACFIDFRTDGLTGELPPKLGIWYPYRFFWSPKHRKWFRDRSAWDNEMMNNGSHQGIVRRGKKWDPRIIGFDLERLPLGRKK